MFCSKRRKTSFCFEFSSVFIASSSLQAAVSWCSWCILRGSYEQPWAAAAWHTSVQLKRYPKNCLLACKHEKPAMMLTARSCLEDHFAAKRKLRNLETLWHLASWVGGEVVFNPWLKHNVLVHKGGEANQCNYSMKYCLGAEILMYMGTCQNIRWKFDISKWMHLWPRKV